MKSAQSMAIRARRPAAFVLLEVLLAIMVFGMAAVGLVAALTMSSRAANESKLDLRMIAILESELTKHSRKPNLREMKPGDEGSRTEVDELGVWAETTITEIKDGKPYELKNADNQDLQQMFLIEVVAYYERDGRESTMTASTIRYAPLYRTNQAAQ